MSVFRHLLIYKSVGMYLNIVYLVIWDLPSLHKLCTCSRRRPWFEHGSWSRTDCISCVRTVWTRAVFSRLCLWCLFRRWLSCGRGCLRWARMACSPCCLQSKTSTLSLYNMGLNKTYTQFHSSVDKVDISFRPYLTWLYIF